MGNIAVARVELKKFYYLLLTLPADAGRVHF